MYALVAMLEGRAEIAGALKWSLANSLFQVRTLDRLEEARR